MNKKMSLKIITLLSYSHHWLMTSQKCSNQLYIEFIRNQMILMNFHNSHPDFLPLLRQNLINLSHLPHKYKITKKDTCLITKSSQ